VSNVRCVIASPMFGFILFFVAQES